MEEKEDDSQIEEEDQLDFKEFQDVNELGVSDFQDTLVLKKENDFSSPICCLVLVVAFFGFELNFANLLNLTGQWDVLLFYLGFMTIVIACILVIIYKIKNRYDQIVFTPAGINFIWVRANRVLKILKKEEFIGVHVHVHFDHPGTSTGSGGGLHIRLDSISKGHGLYSIRLRFRLTNEKNLEIIKLEMFRGHHDKDSKRIHTLAKKIARYIEDTYHCLVELDSDTRDLPLNSF